ncbi:AAA family ATPase [Clostridium sardiniense]|uniref:AAA family ATPase n=1 Tax=Clostridium sardiniense TaxID=29369 RepID=A0ABS7KYG8_CLOSR|nr:AAA family ATPase [Clostridium sardiniense]MBY0755861.1 AAA family ATPase [Clostridium sardiniense]MDQ0459911.1 hypothetical protein [Clostridium sardiniense]
MRTKLESIFNLYGQTSTVEEIDNNPELYLINSSAFNNPIIICVKGLTFGGRENLSYEQRVQIKGVSNNYAYNKLIEGEKAILLGLIFDSNINDFIICAWKLKYSTASNTLSKQIKNETIRKATIEGFAQQRKGNNELACAFRKEFLHFYIQNSEWIHDGNINELNEHISQYNLGEYTSYNNGINEKNRIKGGENILLYGVPGSGKSHTIKNNYCNERDKIERIVFHPDYTYSDFVGQILPCLNEDGMIKYNFNPGPFTRLLEKAENNGSNEYYLIIEEINRGNAPAIFGEVFQLLDRDEDGKSVYGISNADIAKVVYNDENHLVELPSNMNILATMNTSDQNVFTLDTAFQRRWSMRIIENNVKLVKYANKKILDTNVSWLQFNEIINSLILETNYRMSSAEDKRLGAYFVRENDLTYDSKEIDENATDNERIVAIRQNSKFPEKILKYLWDDAFRFSREIIFNIEEYHSLEDVIKQFKKERGNRRFKVFKTDLFNLGINEE